MMAAFDPVTAVLDIGGKLIDRLWPDPAQREAAKGKLAELQKSGELARMANETETLKTLVADVASARDREAKIATAAEAPKFNKIITPLLATLIVGLSFVIFAILIFGGEIPVSRKDVVIYMLGVLSAALLQVLNYYFGTSQGSTHASQLFRDMIRKSGG